MTEDRAIAWGPTSSSTRGQGPWEPGEGGTQAPGSAPSGLGQSRSLWGTFQDSPSGVCDIAMRKHSPQKDLFILHLMIGWHITLETRHLWNQIPLHQLCSCVKADIWIRKMEVPGPGIFSAGPQRNSRLSSSLPTLSRCQPTLTKGSHAWYNPTKQKHGIEASGGHWSFLSDDQPAPRSPEKGLVFINRIKF